MKIKEVTLEKPTSSADFKHIKTLTKDRAHFFSRQSNVKWSHTLKLYRNPSFIKIKSNDDEDSRYTRCEDEIVEDFFAEGLPYRQMPNAALLLTGLLPSIMACQRGFSTAALIHW